MKMRDSTSDRQVRFRCLTLFLCALFTGSLLIGQAHGQCVPTAFPADWLQAQEAFGGHTVARHVGKTDEWLVNRLSKSSRISAASTYPNAETATTHIQAALTAKTAMLNQWVRDAPAGATRAVDYLAGKVLGRIALRPPKLTNIINSKKMRAVMRATTNGTCFLLTSYPIR
jgi:hypothetical protein